MFSEWILHYLTGYVRRELAGSAYELIGFFEVLPLAKEAMKPLYTDY